MSDAAGHPRRPGPERGFLDPAQRRPPGPRRRAASRRSSASRPSRLQLDVAATLEALDLAPTHELRIPEGYTLDLVVGEVTSGLVDRIIWSGTSTQSKAVGGHLDQRLPLRRHLEQRGQRADRDPRPPPNRPGRAKPIEHLPTLAPGMDLDSLTDPRPPRGTTARHVRSRARYGSSAWGWIRVQCLELEPDPMP